MSKEQSEIIHTRPWKEAKSCSERVSIGIECRKCSIITEGFRVIKIRKRRRNVLNGEVGGDVDAVGEAVGADEGSFESGVDGGEDCSVEGDADVACSSIGRCSSNRWASRRKRRISRDLLLYCRFITH